MANNPVAPPPRPAGPVVMRQLWRRLLFLHWACDAADVHKTLPEGLTVDSWEGRAWIGLVPFRMERVRPRFCPPVPGISDFPELNVRTYVRDSKGRPGVWFYSLDCAQPLAVWIARAVFGLPYFRARMSERVGEDISYTCRRAGHAETARFRYRPAESSRRANRGSFEEFLVERYRLFAAKDGGLFTGEVWHEPYELRCVDIAQWSDLPLRQAGFAVSGRAPDHAAFSSGVDARIFAPAPVGGC